MIKVDVLDLLVGDCWTSYANTNVDDGRGVSSANTVSACQQACVDEPQCTGVDFVSNADEGGRCWMSGSWSGRRNDGRAPGVTHYDFDRNCNAGNMRCVYYAKTQHAVRT